MYVVLIYGLIVNVIGFIVMGADKMKAKRKSRRVPEKRLFLWAFLGGAAGVWIAMQVWRHKTKHESFTVGIPFIFILNVLCMYLLLKWLFYPRL
ncbi:DUF1294 domain-containing protein [Paenibacillus validus]|uniref:DUF1294 domain-containing protein n=1 Tax=Paenibacillus validus TaxID=44253 RepID=A0A7X2ZC22_9BACL|nr:MULTISPECIES: DUF1294 domain-containing protein [Paenibacillus]MED4599244.1 DUF1294 domain-containing protein [Paenibacillus validus]MED4606449.1 DUF1294 domain-containing protein [Paenibacillus validus]MUG71510.1 DUF1294 domain-containing protein [Paenibacillus validus]